MRLLSTPPTSSSYSALFNVPSPPDFYTLSLHDALPICLHGESTGPVATPSMETIARRFRVLLVNGVQMELLIAALEEIDREQKLDRKSTRLNSSHVAISYAVFCLKKKKTQQHRDARTQR